MKDLRQNYTKSQLLENNIPQNPIELFHSWFQDALKGGVIEPNAFVLSTVNDGMADARTILLKGERDSEFVFYTNYESNKSKQLEKNNNCSLLFLWLPVERQLIIRGKAKKVTAKESDEYFNSRPKLSQIGAWASNQSSPVNSRTELEKVLKKLEDKYENIEVPRPDHWGGFAIEPTEIEFWQGRANRLHDRLIYVKNGDSWIVKRLQP